jgi:hypothetical protein
MNSMTPNALAAAVARPSSPTMACAVAVSMTWVGTAGIDMGTHGAKRLIPGHLERGLT